jgi:hypothetical protein
LYEKEIKDSKGVYQGLTKTATKVREVKQAVYKASELQEMESLVTVQSEGKLAEELHTVERVKRICEVLCSRPVSVLYQQTTELSKL